MKRGAAPLIAWVWWCGDEWCDCTEPQIITRSIPRRKVWEGTFRTDSEDGADAELDRVAEAMRREWPEVYARIEWPWEQ